MNFVDLPSAKTEIVDKLGYFPTFLTPAIQFPAIFCSLVEQTLLSYKQNPLPVVFKEKLFVYLSRYYGVSYFSICHSCELRSLDVAGSEILSLAKIEFPQTEADIQADLKLLRSRFQKDVQLEKEIETSLLRCASFIFAHPSESASCCQTLDQILGTVNYNYLLVLLGYIKLCHQWVNNNPDIDHKQDSRSQLHLSSLLLSQIELANFFQTQGPQKENLECNRQRKQRLPLFFKSATEANSISKFKSETLKAFSSYLENLPFPVMICNDSEEIMFLNHSWLDATGYTASEISTLNDWSQKAKVTINQSETIRLSSPNSGSRSAMMPIERYALQLKEIATETKTTLQRIIDSLMVMATGIAQNYGDDKIFQEVSIITKKGVKRFWQLHSSTLVYDYGDRKLTISIAKDITDIHQANLKLRLISEATQTSTWSWNLENNQINLGYCGRSILGLNNFDGSYTSFLSSIHPDERESVDLSIVRTIQTKGDLNLEYRVVKPNQDISWIRFQGKLNYDSQGQAIELEGVVTDITQHKLLPQKTQTVKEDDTWESSPQLETIFELIPNYTFVVDVDKTISYINTALIRGFNLPSVAQVKGKKISECFPSDYVRQIAWLHQQVLTYGEVLRIQEEATLVDGVHYFNTVITPIKNDRGEVEALLHTSNDIPNLAATQEALSERTIQLEAANRELESFSYSVSHDLQAPLRVINGFSQVLWETCQSDLDDRGKHFIERIQANSQKMSDLIDALLELSRVTRSQMKSVDVNLSDIARDLIEELQGQDPQRQVEITIAPNLQTTGDPQLLRIVLNNLLNNAWKYTSKRSQAKIEFDVLHSPNVALSDLSTTTIYYIRDNGAGFDQEYVDKLFTAFQRLHGQSEFPGTGIGLATVQRIIYRHGGKVWAEGESDRGTTIYFSL